jgi:hypothetical protein
VYVPGMIAPNLRHGDIRVRVALRCEPQKLVNHWRRSFGDNLPISASITMLRSGRRPKNDWWWANYYSPHLDFEGMTRTEKKRAELSISEASLKMLPTEIAAAADLTNVFFDWLSQRRGLPEFSNPIRNAVINIEVEGDASLLPAIETLKDPEILSRATIGAVYLQGEPRRPEIRWLPALNDLNTSQALADISNFERSLADGQAAELRSQIAIASRLFRGKRDARRTSILKRYAKLFGLGGQVEIIGRPLTDEMLYGLRHETVCAWLDAQEQDQAKVNARGKPAR